VRPFLLSRQRAITPRDHVFYYFIAPILGVEKEDDYRPPNVFLGENKGLEFDVEHDLVFRFYRYHSC
jgi:hypothetical protein